MILRECPTCQRRTDQDRRQWGEADPPTVVTEYTCTECGVTDTTRIKYEVQPDE